MTIPLCKDCARRSVAFFSVGYLCCKTKGQVPPVCAEERAPFPLGLRLFSNRCGPEGRHFIAKD